MKTRSRGRPKVSQSIQDQDYDPELYDAEKDLPEYVPRGTRSRRGRLSETSQESSQASSVSSNTVAAAAAAAEPVQTRYGLRARK